MFQHLADEIKQLKEKIMTIEDQVSGLVTAVTALTAAVAAIPTAPVAPTVDFTPILDAIASVAAQLQPTPAPAPTPEPAPEAPAA
jgi:L-serine deaminase